MIQNNSCWLFIKEFISRFSCTALCRCLLEPWHEASNPIGNLVLEFLQSKRNLELINRLLDSLSDSSHLMYKWHTVCMHSVQIICVRQSPGHTVYMTIHVRAGIICHPVTLLLPS